MLAQKGMSWTKTVAKVESASEGGKHTHTLTAR